MASTSAPPAAAAPVPATAESTAAAASPATELPYTTSWLTGPHSTRFHTRLYLPPPPLPTHAVVIYIHGFAEHVGRYTHFHPLLSAKGVAVFAFDQRGFGETALDEKERSRGSGWGKTSWREQMEDVAWAVGHVKKELEGKPVFLVGHSMGGGEALGFVSLDPSSQHHATALQLKGAVATSPLITQTHPAPKLAKWLGAKASVLLPNTVIPAPVKAEDLSHDPAFNAAYLADPLIKASGTLRGLSDMLGNGEKLLKTGCRRWTGSVPLLIVHGTADQVTNHKSSETFIQSLPKGCNGKISLVKDGFHELQNEPDGVKERVANEIVEFVLEHAGVSTPSTSASTQAEGDVVGAEAEAEVGEAEAGPAETTKTAASEGEGAGASEEGEKKAEGEGEAKAEKEEGARVKANL